MHEIDIEWAASAYAAVFETFGPELNGQLVAFNEALRSTPEVDHEIRILALAMARAGYPRPHYSLLNLLSETSDSNNAADPIVRRFAAPLFLLEHDLRLLRLHNFRLGAYRTMMMAPHSFDSLIGEVDVIAQLLQAGGTITPHALTATGQETNYDVHWERDGVLVRGDVKYFQDWLRKGDNGVLDALKILLRSDLRCGVTVTLRMGFLADGPLLNVALQVLELYRAAMGEGPCPEGARVVHLANNERSAVTFSNSESQVVREVRPMPGTSPGSIVVIDVGFGSGNEDEDVVRRNLRSAARQVPPSTSSNELAVAFIGSAIPASANDLRVALFGQPYQDPLSGEITEPPGYFSPNTPEVDLAHIEAAFFFSIHYDAGPESSRVMVHRRGRAFERPGLSETQRQTIDEIGRILSIDGTAPASIRAQPTTSM